jgi:Protein of unknown function (DUF1007)
MIRQLRTIDAASAASPPGIVVAAIAAIVGFFPPTALAHPHVLVTARTDILLNGQGQLTSITNIWEFDEAYSAFVIQGYDSNGDGILSRQELQPLAEVNVKSLADYGYFTRVGLAGAKVTFGHPSDYFDIFKEEKLTLQFTLPLERRWTCVARRFRSPSMIQNILLRSRLLGIVRCDCSAMPPAARVWSLGRSRSIPALRANLRPFQPLRERFPPNCSR